MSSNGLHDDIAKEGDEHYSGSEFIHPTTEIAQLDEIVRDIHIHSFSSFICFLNFFVQTSPLERNPVDAPISNLNDEDFAVSY